MSYKLLLAEALEVLKKAARDETECDRLQVKLSESSKRRSELPNLRRNYAKVFESRIRGLEMLNHVRVMTDDNSLKAFCADQMVGGMDACERVRDKETSILLPAAMVQGTFTSEKVTHVGDRGQRVTVDTTHQTGTRSDGVLVTKDGYARTGDPIFEMGHNGEETLSGGNPFREEWTLLDGAYQLAIINNDSFTIAAPAIDVMIQSESPSTGQRMLYRKKLPPGCAWCRFIGVVNTSVVRLAIASDAWMRHSKVRVELSRISNAKDQYGNPIREAAPVSPEQLEQMEGQWNAEEAAATAAATARVPRGRPAGGGKGDGFVAPYPTKGGGGGGGTTTSHTDDSVPSWLEGAHMPTGYASELNNAGANEMPSMAAMLAPMSIVGPAPPPSTAASSNPAEAFAVANPNYSGPRVDISPVNCTPEQRLQKIRNASWQWYSEGPHGFGGPQFNQSETQANRDLMAAIIGLEEPTPLE